MYLGPHDPPPYSVFNEESRSRVLFVCDHSGRAFPERLNRLGLADWVLEKHVAWDIGSGDVAHHLSARFDTPLVCSNYSRLVVDNNRHPEDPTVCITLSEGIAIPGNMDLSPVERERRFESIFDPYHAAIERQLNVIRERGEVPVLIAIHSCTPVFDRVVRPWHIGVLWDKDPRIAVPLLEILGEMDDVCIGDNEPYSGKDPHDYTIDHHGEAARIPHVSIEIRQDLIDSSEGAERWAGILGDALEEILEDEELYSLMS